MKESILRSRMTALNSVMEKHQVESILILNPGMGNFGGWLFAAEGVPTPAPFDRNNAYLVRADGQILKLCQTTTHPTDRAQFPHFEDTDLSDIFAAPQVGIVHPEFLKKNVRDHLTAAYPNFVFRDLTGAVYAEKARKSEAEITQLTQAAMEYDRLFCAMPLILRAERLEKEVVNEVRQRLSWQGVHGETPGFHSMVELTSAPDGGPAVEEPLYWSGRRLQYGDRVNITVRGYLGNGFSSTLGRSFVLGPASAEAEQYWALAVEAQALAASLAKPDVTIRDICTQVNAFLQAHSLPADSSAWIHGLGTAVYESPRSVDASADLPLSEGTVLSIGPAIMPPGKDSYRCTDPFVITADGAVRLSTTSQALQIL